jgi:hypothetical protein
MNVKEWLFNLLICFRLHQSNTRNLEKRERTLSVEIPRRISRKKDSIYGNDNEESNTLDKYRDRGKI